MPRSGAAAPAPSPSSGSKAAASRSAVQSCCRNSGTTFSPSTRLARITEDSRFCDAAPDHQVFERRDLVGGHHRDAGERELERHRAGLRQRRPCDAERGMLVGRFDHDPRAHRPMRRRRPDRVERDAPRSARRPRPRPIPRVTRATRLGKDIQQPLRSRRVRLPGSTSSTGGVASRRCASAGVRPQICHARSASGWPT